MGVTKEIVEATLTSKLSPTHLVFRVALASFWIGTIGVLPLTFIKEVVDTSGGCGASFVVEIVSKEFEGKRLLDRHRMVNAALEKEMQEIHALSIKKALTPEQWEQQSQPST